MERTEFRSEATRLLRDVQYLRTWLDNKVISGSCRFSVFCFFFGATYFVTLRILRSRMHLSTEKPRGATAPAENMIISRMPQRTTKKSKRLKRDMK